MKNLIKEWRELNKDSRIFFCSCCIFSTIRPNAVIITDFVVGTYNPMFLSALV